MHGSESRWPSSQMLRANAFGASAPDNAATVEIGRLPVVSLMVPLFREDDIAPRLIRTAGAA